MAAGSNPRVVLQPDCLGSGTCIDAATTVRTDYRNLRVSRNGISRVVRSRIQTRSFTARRCVVSLPWGCRDRDEMAEADGVYQSFRELRRAFPSAFPSMDDCVGLVSWLPNLSPCDERQSEDQRSRRPAQQQEQQERPPGQRSSLQRCTVAMQRAFDQAFKVVQSWSKGLSKYPELLLQFDCPHPFASAYGMARRHRQTDEAHCALVDLFQRLVFLEWFISQFPNVRTLDSLQEAIENLQCDARNRETLYGNATEHVRDHFMAVKYGALALMRDAATAPLTLPKSVWTMFAKQATTMLRKLQCDTAEGDMTKHYFGCRELVKILTQRARLVSGQEVYAESDLVLHALRRLDKLQAVFTPA